MKTQALVELTIPFIFLGTVLAASAQAAPDDPFPEATARFEQNATDGDVEVVFEVKAGDEGLVKLRVTSPEGRTVVDFRAPDDSTLGIRQFRFESPEPGDTQSLRSAYTEGTYTFAGATAHGQRFHGESILSHQLPATVNFLTPTAGARGVPTKSLTISWSHVDSLSAYLIEIEQDDLNVNLSAKLPATASSFSVPNGFLLPGTEYELSVGTVAKDGNMSFVETKFTTAE